MPLSQHLETAANPKYRPDIDGLRAIAVVLVIGYHAFPYLFKSGFIGVDIFFVISGFLISSIIFGELNKNNFSYKEFYARRIKRIFPALLLMLLVCIILGNFYLLADEYRALGRNIAAGAAYVSNFATWSDAGYFDTANYSKPLLHLWSLAIEEQFYIFWPLLLGLLWKIKNKNYLLLTTLVIGIGSFGFNILTIGANQTAAFYSPLSRFWELMIGGLLAYLSIFRSQFLEPSSNKRSAFGFLLIIVGIIFISQNSSYPGWLAMLPTAGSFFVISGGPNAWLNRKLLSKKLLVGIGLISYPLYLWHWPLLSFARIIFGQNLPFRVLFLVIVTSFILSYLTYKLVEKRVRSTKRVRLTVLVLVSSMFIVFLIGLLIIKNQGFPSRTINNKQNLYNPALHVGMRIPLYGIIFSDESCKKFLGKQRLIVGCHANSAEPQLLFGGDSHAMSLYSAIADGKISVPSLLVSGGSCPLYFGINGTGNSCSSVVKDFISFAKLPSVKNILIINAVNYINNTSTVSNYSYNNKVLTDEEAFIAGYSNLLSTLSKLNKNIIFVLDIPRLPADPRDCVQRSLLMDNSKKECGINSRDFQTARLGYLKLVSELQAKYPKLKIYDAAKNLCDKNECAAKDDQDYFYFDNNHLTVYGSEKILTDLLSVENLINH